MHMTASTLFPFWNKLTPQEQNLFVQSLTRKPFDAGTLLSLGSTSCSGMLFVEKGLLRVYLISPEGREVTLYRVFSGEFCILSASCILDHISFDVYISAMEQTETIRVDSSIILKISKSNPFVENFIYKQSAERFSDVMWAMQQILFMSFDKRLASFLLDEKQRTGSDTIRMTHEQISHHVGSAREVVSRMLSRFAADGLVEVFRGGIRILDAGRLDTLIGRSL